MLAGQFDSRGAYTFFRHSKRKVTALRLHSRAYSRHFTHTMTKNRINSCTNIKKTAANSLARSFLKLNLLIPLINF